MTRTDLTTGKSEIITGLYEGRIINSPNDITIDEQGEIEDMNNLDQAVYAYELPTNVDFGRDEDSTVLYVPSGKSVYRITLNSEGYQLLACNLKPRACASLPWVARLEPGDVDFQHRRSVASLPAATLLFGFGTSGMVALRRAFR